MSVLYRRSLAGRLPRSPEIETLQARLNDLGHSPNGIDGIFGGETEKAVKSWQRVQGLEETGTVIDEAWRTITELPVPAVFCRCLSVTAAFEGTGFTRALGNWDGAWLTWGIIGFTLRHGNLVRVLGLTDARVPELIDVSFGNRAPEIRALVTASDAERRAWADAQTENTRSGRLNGEIADGFEILGGAPAVQEIQVEVAFDEYWSIAVRDMRRFGLMTEVGAMLCFDTAVQNGGINRTKRTLAEQQLAAEPDADARRVMEIIANAIADGSSQRFREDVRRRKTGIVSLEASVHGARYLLPDWGIRPDAALAEGDLSRQR